MKSRAYTSLLLSALAISTIGAGLAPDPVPQGCRLVRRARGAQKRCRPEAEQLDRISAALAKRQRRAERNLAIAPAEVKHS